AAPGEGGDAAEPLSAIYLDVLKAQAERNVELRRWRRAVEHYEEAYAEELRLKEQLEEDERQIDGMLRRPSEGGPGELLEFAVLNDSELQAVSDALRIDYRSLLGRLLATAERLHRLREEETRAAMRTSRELFLGVRYHGIAARLHELRVALQESAPAALPRIDRLKAELQSWRILDQSVFEPVTIELGQTVRELIAGSVAFERHRAHIGVREGPDCRILFDEVSLGCILENLVFNVYEAASSTSRPGYTIRFRVFERDGLVWLGCEDDVGGYPAYADIVEQVNAGGGVHSPRGADRGQGLWLVRGFIEHVSRLTAPWSLHLLENGCKELLIPVARPIHNA
ncbi:hypothetical protein, partial [Longimicrobium sp.]|uniref:hypothetical protein n=1 Tax=Longimicrobium sp. TaxID=2029185 RepID=UPI002E303471